MDYRSNQITYMFTPGGNSQKLESCKIEKGNLKKRLHLLETSTDEI